MVEEEKEEYEKGADYEEGEEDDDEDEETTYILSKCRQQLYMNNVSSANVFRYTLKDLISFITLGRISCTCEEHEWQLAFSMQKEFLSKSKICGSQLELFYLSKLTLQLAHVRGLLCHPVHSNCSLVLNDWFSMGGLV